jgi:hypothetical protein
MRNSTTTPKGYSTTTQRGTAPQRHRGTALQRLGYSATTPKGYSTTGVQHHKGTAPQGYSTTTPQGYSTTTPRANIYFLRTFLYLQFIFLFRVKTKILTYFFLISTPRVQRHRGTAPQHQGYKATSTAAQHQRYTGVQRHNTKGKYLFSTNFFIFTKISFFSILFRVKTKILTYFSLLSTPIARVQRHRGTASQHQGQIFIFYELCYIYENIIFFNIIQG